ncbi:MAG TPA: PAS domain S-box protein, partial [Aggregatilineaceae bacterium]|nr:PAS domain S-box protein [Aggregatilineaceae bacterium]
MDGILNIPARQIHITLRTKMLALIGLLLLGLIVVLSALSQTILLGSFADLEERSIRRNTQRVLNALNDDLADLNTLAADWARRDDTSAFVGDGNAGFIEKNLTPATFTALHLNLVLVFDASGQLVHGEAFDLENQIGIPLSGRLIDLYLASDSLLSHYTKPTDAGVYMNGVVVTPEGTLLIAIQPVLGPGHQGPVQGTLILGRLLDEGMTTALAQSTDVSLQIHYFVDPNLPADFRRAHQAMLKGANVYVAPLDRRNIAGYVSVNDISGEPALLMRTEMPRDIYLQGQKSVGFFLLAALGVGLMVSAVLLLLIEHQVLTRLLRLSVAVGQIGAVDDAAARLPVKGRDELASLADSINAMLAAVQRSRTTLAESQVRLQQIIGSISDTIYSVEFDDHQQVISHRILSPQLAQLTGYPISRFNADWSFWSSLVVPEDRPRVSAYMDGLRAGLSDEIEYRVRRTDGDIVWVRDSIHVEKRPGDPHMTVYGVISDITARKLAEEKLRESERLAREFQEKLKALNEASLELSKASSLDDLYRRAIELGLSSLGFDRLGLWLLDHDQQTMIGTFGTGPDGQIRDEREWHNAVAADPRISESISRKERVIVWEDQPLLERWEEIGRGWNAMAALWDGDRTIGFLAADNLIHQRPLYPHETELLRLYGTVLGHLCTRLQSEEALRQAHADLERRVGERTLELAQANAALSAERTLLRTLIDALPDAIYIKDTQSRFLGTNVHHASALGLARPEDLIGKTDFDFYPLEYAERFFTDEQAIFQTGQPLINHEEPWLSPLGESGWSLTTKVPLHDEVGNVIGLIGIGHDITERKLAEDVLRQAHEELERRVQERTAELSTANARLREEIAERQQAEEALAAERNLLRVLIDHLPDSVYVKDVEGRVLLANQADARIMGAAGPDDVIGKTDFDFHPPDLAAQYYADDMAVVQSGQSIVDREEPLFVPGEDYHWLLTTKVPLRDSQGRVIGLVGIGHDITERKQAEEALRQSEERYSSLFDGVPATLYRTAPDGRFLDVNPALAELIGCEDPEDMLADNVATFYVRPEDRDRWRALIERENIVRDFELQVRRRDGSVIWVRDTARAVRDEAGNVLYYEGTLKDVTAQKRAEEALRESEERLELALRGAELGLWDWNLQIDRVVVDQRWADMLGYSLDEVNRHSVELWERLVHPDDAAEARAALRDHLEGRTSFYESEYRLRAKSGEWKWIQDRGKIVNRGDDGVPLRVTGTHLDITGRKQAEAEREQLLRQTRTRAAELATVAEVSRQATTILNVDHLLATVADLIQENFGWYHVQIYLLDEKGKTLSLVAAPGEIGRQLVAQKLGIPLRSRQSLVARAARTQQCVVVNDVTQDPAYLAHPLLPDTRSEMAVPMVAGDTLIGVLNVEADRLDRFGTEDVNIHTTLAAQVAIAIHNARLFTDNARRLAIIENSSSLIALADLRKSPYRLAYINPAGLRMLGYGQSQEVLGQGITGFYSEESLSYLRAKAIPTALEEGVWRGESQLKRSDGALIPVEMTLFTIPDEQGHPHHLATIINDISERKRAEQDLRQSEERLELALRGAELGLWDYTIQTGEAIFNQRWAEMLGFGLDEIEPCIDTWHRLLHPDDAKDAIASLLDHLQGHTPFYESEHRLHAKSGEWKWILARGKVVERDESGQPVRATGTHLDITARKQAEAALHESQQMLQLVMENVPQAIFWKDRNLVYIGCNREFCQDAGVKSPAEIIGRTDFDLAWRDHAEQYRADDRLVLETGASRLSYEEPQTGPGGEALWLRTSKVPLRNTEGEVVGVLGTYEDITERRKADEALRRANRAYRILSDCNQAMVRATDESGLLNNICQIVADSGGYRMAWVGFVEDGERQTLRPVARAGYEGGQVDSAVVPEAMTSGGPAVIAVQTGMPCIVPNVATDPLVAPGRDEVLAHGYSSMISLPLQTDGQVFGVVNVYASVPDAFDPAEVGLLVELVGDLAYGITVLRTRLERQRAEEQLRQSEANLSALIENTDDIVWSVDADYRIITMNSSLRRTFLQSFGVALKPGMRTTDYLPAEDQADRKMLYDRALHGDRTTVERHYEYGKAPPVDVEMSFNPIVASD